jgi:hypothetical protein
MVRARADERTVEEEAGDGKGFVGVGEKNKLQISIDIHHILRR